MTFGNPFFNCAMISLDILVPNSDAERDEFTTCLMAILYDASLETGIEIPPNFEGNVPSDIF
jgi:hypothetical protein